ncbi:MAG: NADAR family protein [Acidimicrobiales bacterium]
MADHDGEAIGPEAWAVGPTIAAFRNEHRFLSNFWPAPVLLDGDRYPSVEHAYQAAKSADPTVRRSLREVAEPGHAKRIGREIEIDGSWAERRLAVMADLLRQKFETPELRGRLRATGTRTLVEGNGWGDVFWGVCRGAGTNHLGNLLATVRAEAQGLSSPVLALDLEGTILSSAVSCFVRPRAFELLEWARTRFADVVVFTTVPEPAARRALLDVVGLEELPPWLLDCRVLHAPGGAKDLRRVADLDQMDVVLLDDQPTATVPGQERHWVPVAPWNDPTSPDDALWGARTALDAAIAAQQSIRISRAPSAPVRQAGAADGR